MFIKPAHHLRHWYGFTLVEVLVVISLIAFVAIPSILSFSNIRNRQALILGTENLISSLKRAHIYAREAKGESAWGIKFSCNNGYSLWSKDLSGAVKAEVETGLPEPIIFDNCSTSVPSEIWFKRGTGDASGDYILFLRPNNSLSPMLSKIIVNSNGSIESE